MYLEFVFLPEKCKEGKGCIETRYMFTFLLAGNSYIFNMECFTHTDILWSIMLWFPATKNVNKAAYPRFC